MGQPINSLNVRNLIVKSVGDLYANNVYCTNEMTSDTLTLNTLTSNVSIDANSIQSSSLTITGYMNATTIMTNSITSNIYLNLPEATTVTKGVIKLDDSFTSDSRITAPTSNALYKLQQNVEMVNIIANRWVQSPGSSNLTYTTGFVGIGVQVPLSTLHVLGEVQITGGNFFVKNGTMCIGSEPVITGYKLQVRGDVFIDGNIYITGNIYQV